MRTLATSGSSTRCIGALIALYSFSGFSARGQSEPPHRMFLAAPLPADGVDVEFNAPILRWPYRKGKGSRYEVTLSKDSLFGYEYSLGATADGPRARTISR